MNNKTFICLVFCAALTIFGCSKDNSARQSASDLSNASAATQVSGVGFIYADDPCDAVGQGAAFALTLTGDLEGCDYFFIDEFECSPSGTYREKGRELFVGTYKGQSGTFRTTYRFEGKYEGCPENGEPLGAEIFGRCQHPIVEGSGTGIFEGITGRFNFIDDIEAGNYPYKGHLKF